MPDESELSVCFAQRIAAWFAETGRSEVRDAVLLRQMNMAIALAASRWNEFSALDGAPDHMHDWLDEVERRARARKADARVDAIRRAREWFDECLAEWRAHA